jgi:NAD+ synthase (glutamine-hydrolysing)
MRLALAPLNPTIGDIDANAALIIARLDEARAHPGGSADLVVFPELALCGYPPRDLLLHEGFINACAAAAKRIGEEHTRGLTAVFGLPLPADDPPPPSREHREARKAGDLGGTGRGRIANSLLVYRDNRYVDYYDKRLLPTYDVFDEDRYFTPGDRPVVITCGKDNTRVGLAICEDLWRGEDAGFASRYADAADPVAELAAQNIDLLVSPSASPFVLGKWQRHQQILQKHARAHRIHIASVNQLGGNDDLIFDGHTAVYSPAGELLAATQFDGQLTILDIPPAAPTQDAKPRIQSAVPEDLLFSALTLGTRDYIRKCGFKTAVLGISGGIDSALVAALAAAAIGPEHVTGLILPGRYSSEHSKADARDLAERLGIRAIEIPIDPPFESFRAAIDPAFASIHHKRLGESLPDITEENVQSRIRGTLLMTFSNRTGAIVLTTGNKSELAVGYATLYGDMNGGLAPIADITKMQVYALARWINENHRARGFASPPIPESSITKVPSAELRPDQTDQDSLPPYDILDRIVGRYIERKQSPASIIRDTGIDEATVRRITRLIDAAEYKRRQAATGLKVTTVAFGSGRRIPIAQRWRP